MKFSVEYDKQPIKFLKKLDKHISKRIIEKIDDVLGNSLVPHDAKRIAGKKGIFRIRIGKYRVLYRINNKEGNSIIIKIEKRSKVYQ